RALVAAATPKAAAAAAALRRPGRRISPQVPRDAVQPWRRPIARQLEPPDLLAFVVGDLDRHLRVTRRRLADAVGEERAVRRVLVGRVAPGRFVLPQFVVLIR